LSADGRGINVEIEGNTMRVANEIYHLGNIARVSTYTIKSSALRAIWAKKGSFLLTAVVIAGLVIGNRVAGQHLQNHPATLRHVHLAEQIGVAAFGLIGVLALARILLALRPRATPHILLIESSGVVRGLLASKDIGVIDDIATLIADSIRNPPITAISRHFTNVTTNFNHNDVKHINQYGAGAVTNFAGNVSQQFHA
jgi:Family of unknown function (DUF6232)